MVAIVVAGLALAGCGKDSPPKAFPGSALDKAKELTRREAELGLPHRSVKGAVFAYGTVGDGFCVDEDPKVRMNGGFPESRREREEAIRMANLVVDIYCPWLPHYPE